VNDDRDPLIHGPSVTVQAAASALGPDLETSSPWSDFLDLLRRPRALFLAVGRGTSQRTLWKASLGYVFLAWVAGFVAAQREIARGLTEWANAVDKLGSSPVSRRVLQFFSPEGDLEAGRAKLLATGAGFTQATVFVSPLLVVAGLAFSVSIAALLLPMLGVEKERVKFQDLFVSQLYANWFVFLAIVPFVGGLVSWLLPFFMGILAVKWICETTWFRSFVALKFLSIVFLVIVVAAFAGLFAVLVRSSGA
jgi:hypothetical protein